MNIDTLNHFTKTIDALCREAAFSSNEYDLPVLSVMLDDLAWGAERALGYRRELAGEVDHWCNSCWEDSRVVYWLPKLEALPPAESFDEKVALAYALHHGAWYLNRVKLFGPKEYS